MEIEAGQRLGPYLLEQKLPGAGGMGTVFRARHVETGRIYALKVIKSDLAQHPVARARFDREARILQRLEHPNVVKIVDYDADRGTSYIVTEFARDGDLRNFIAGEMETKTLLSILRQAAEGLQAAHDAHIVHRDVKPANLLVEREDGEMRIMVTDFGVAWGKDFSTHYTAPGGRGVGTRLYKSPECERAEEADCRADVYSLGICLNRMLGKSAKEGPVVAVIAKAASYWPDDRHRSVMELYEDAERALRARGTGWVAPQPWDDLAETRLDTPAGGTLAPDGTGRPAVLDQVLARLGIQDQVHAGSLARGRGNPMLITGMLTVADPEALGRAVGELANELARELKVDRVRLVLLPSGQAVPDIVRTYFSVLFAEEVPPEDFDQLAARRIDDLLEIDAPPRIDGLCDEDALVPLVAQLRVKNVRLNPQPVR
jgi:serine/threonine-protein kinase